MSETKPIWSLAAAQARLDDVIDRAVAEGPQMLDDEGGTVAVVVSVEEWARLTRGEAASDPIAERDVDPAAPIG